MERKTEHFFDWDKLNTQKVMNQIWQHPQEMEKIIKYVAEKVEHFAEFRVKKDHLKEDYDNAVQDLYAEYMRE